MATLINARYAGTCRCGCGFPRGAAITYDRVKRRVIGCVVCGQNGRSKPIGFIDVDRQYEDQCSAACGLDGEDR